MLGEVRTWYVAPWFPISKNLRDAVTRTGGVSQPWHPSWTSYFFQQISEVFHSGRTIRTSDGQKARLLLHTLT